jgi:addiction module HigA family antidote
VRELSANRLSLDLGVPSGRITDILNERRSISADTAFRLGRYFGNRPQFWLDLQRRYNLAMVERRRGAEVVERVRPADGGCNACTEVKPRWGTRRIDPDPGTYPQLRPRLSNLIRLRSSLIHT